MAGEVGWSSLNSPEQTADFFATRQPWPCHRKAGRYPRRLMKTFLLALLALVSTAVAADKIKVLIVDGQNNHDWRTITPLLKTIIEESGIFTVQVDTAPGKGVENWQPKFSDYAVVVSNYNGELWSPSTQEAFEKFVSGGGGFVSVHAADNAFPESKAYNEMIGVGGWGGRSEKSGPYLRWRQNTWTTDPTPGRGGSHGSQHEFLLQNRAPEHPIMAGLPAAFLHRRDELYDRLRGPAKNVAVLASAMSPKEKGGSGEEEPLLMAIPFGQGRVFHSALGHGVEAVKCVAFAVTLQRGIEWAATGKVTMKVPAEFPDDKASKARP